MKISFLKDNIDIDEIYNKVCTFLQKKFNAYDDYIQWIVFNSHLKKSIATISYNGDISAIDFDKSVDMKNINLLFPFQCGAYLYCLNSKYGILIIFYHNDQYIYSYLHDREFEHFIEFLYRYLDFNGTYPIFCEQFHEIIIIIKSIYFLQKL